LAWCPLPPFPLTGDKDLRRSEYRSPGATAALVSRPGGVGLRRVEGVCLCSPAVADTRSRLSGPVKLGFSHVLGDECSEAYPSCLHCELGGLLAHCTEMRLPSMDLPCLGCQRSEACRSPDSHVVIRVLGVSLVPEFDEGEGCSVRSVLVSVRLEGREEEYGGCVLSRVVRRG